MLYYYYYTMFVTELIKYKNIFIDEFNRYMTVIASSMAIVINYFNINNLKTNGYNDLRKGYNYIVENIFYCYMYIMQTEIMKYIVHKFKFVVGKLPLSEFTENEFNSVWNIVCMKKYNRYKDICTIIDSYTPLNKIDCDIVYTLKSGNKIVYLPVFEQEVADIDKEDCTIYDILQYRITTQIFDYDLEIDDTYSKLFDESYQYFIPYYIDNKYMDIVNGMYKVNAIY